MTTFRVNVQPSVIVWARESVNLSQEDAARKLGVTAERLREWESGISSPTFKQLKTMAEKYRRPVAVLYLQSPPTHFDTLKEFRKTIESSGTKLPFQLVTELERVRMQQDVIQEIYELEELSPPALSRVLRDGIDAETAAEELRRWLGLELEMQVRWARRDSLVPRLTDLISAKGILVTQVQKVPVNVMRGCALSDHAFPAIVINGSDARAAKVFTLIHELVHILLRASGREGVIPITIDSKPPESQVERYCNSVAAATLIPKEVVMEQFGHISGQRRDAPNIENLRSVSKTLGISAEALLIRLIEMELSTWEYYFAIKDRFPVPKKRESSNDDVNPIYYPLKVRDFGKRYITEVIAAYERSDIGASDIAAYLEVKVNNLDKLIREVNRQQ